MRFLGCDAVRADGRHPPSMRGPRSAGRSGAARERLCQAVGVMPNVANQVCTTGMSTRWSPSMYRQLSV
jgi:hypothetical protein